MVVWRGAASCNVSQAAEIRTDAEWNRWMLPRLRWYVMLRAKCLLQHHGLITSLMPESPAQSAPVSSAEASMADTTTARPLYLSIESLHVIQSLSLSLYLCCVEFPTEATGPTQLQLITLSARCVQKKTFSNHTSGAATIVIEREKG